MSNRDRGLYAVSLFALFTALVLWATGATFAALFPTVTGVAIMAATLATLDPHPDHDTKKDQS